jgi:streptomycin 6-kinase
VPLARLLYAALDVTRDVLVHGDLHHHNLLAASSGYVAIDPKPMLGEREFDVAPFLWNPVSYRMRPDVTERRLAAFAADGLDESRMRAWAVIRAAYLRTDENELDVLRGLV